MRSEHKLLIGERTAEKIKIEIGSAYKLEKELTVIAKGRDLIAGLPKDTEVRSEEIRNVLAPIVNSIVQAVKSALERTPGELSSDIRDRGIVLTGGGAMLKGLDTKLQEETDLPVIMAEDPLTCVVRGTGKVLEDMNRYYKILLND